MQKLKLSGKVSRISDALQNRALNLILRYYFSKQFFNDAERKTRPKRIVTKHRRGTKRVY